MKVLWVVYSIFPDLSVKLGKTIPVGGGWMYGLANDLKENNIDLTVVTVSNNEEFKGAINGINYYLIKAEKDRMVYDTSIEPKWQQIITEVQPDVIHIHGTEFAHGLALMNACPNQKYVISIQGMTSVYSRYYLGGISNKKIWNKYTFRDFLKGDSMWKGQKNFYERGQKVEIPYIKKATDIIGRTQWDHDQVKSINPNVTYHFCNESLRDEFYQSRKWNLKDSKKHTIFVSQAGYPLKGLHKVLEAVSLIKEFFPDILIRVARNPINKTETLRDKIKLRGYGKYLNTLIEKYNLKKHISFTGPLSAEQMVQEYLDCNIFICPSSIENSPNSLGEAQLLGTPCISSYVGGVADMVSNNKTGILYRFEEVEMLAQAIKRVFKDVDLSKDLSENAIIAATTRHNRNTNVNQLINIYAKL